MTEEDKQKQNEKLQEINNKLKEISINVEKQVISIEIFWRELLTIFEKNKSLQRTIKKSTTEKLFEFI